MRSGFKELSVQAEIIFGTRAFMQGGYWNMYGGGFGIWHILWESMREQAASKQRLLMKKELLRESDMRNVILLHPGLAGWSRILRIGGKHAVKQ